MEFIDANIRNIIIQISKVLLCKSHATVSGSLLTREELREKYYIREKFFQGEHAVINKIFTQKDVCYEIMSCYNQQIDDYLNKHKCKGNISDQEISECVSSYSNYVKKLEFNRYDSDVFGEFYSKISDDIEKMHWKFLPLYPSKFIVDRGILPEDNVKKYYNDFYTLKDLMEWVKKEQEEKWIPSLGGDINLGKDLKFSVYTRRWGHYDTYKIKRTLDGWEVSFMAINGKCHKNGEGALVENLDHDNISYPKEEVQEAMETLWELADEEEMSVEELQVKINDIANWISAVEKTVGEYKPDWC